MDDGGGGISELGDSTLDLPSESEGKILSIIPPNDSQILLDSDSLSLPSGQNTLVSEAGFPPTSVMLLFGDCILQEDVQGQEEDYFVNRFIRPNGQHKRGGDFLLFGRNSKEIDKCTALSNVVAADDAEAKENNGFVNNHLYDDEYWLEGAATSSFAVIKMATNSQRP